MVSIRRKKILKMQSMEREEERKEEHGRKEERMQYQ